MSLPIGPHQEPALATVSPLSFVERFELKWTLPQDQGGFGMPSNPALRKLWFSLAEALAQAATERASGQPPVMRVLQFPTGSGKTQGTIMYAAMQAETNAAAGQNASTVGMLIVTRLKDTAQGIADAINALVGRPVAVADHSGHRCTPDELFGADVLVITHEAYRRATTTLSGAKAGREAQLMTWRGGYRLLTVVDEALANIVEESQVRVDELSQTIGVIPLDLETKYPKEVAALRWLRERLLHHAGISDVLGPHFAWYARTGEAFEDLRAEMLRLPYDNMIGRTDPLERGRLARRHDNVLAAAAAVLDHYAYFRMKGSAPTLNSAALAIPLDRLAPVVLDATAGKDFVYELMEHEPLVIPAPLGVRDYSPVTLHVARVSDIGKTAMEKKAHTRIPRVLADLEQRLSKDRSVFFCVHKRVEHLLPEPENMPFKASGSLHWGTEAGSNEYQHFDTAVIVGLHFRDRDTYPDNMFFAMQGVQTDDWFDGPQPWNGHSDLRQTMITRGASVAAVQAMSRIRCRRIVDDQGRCAPCDIFIVLSPNKRGDAILADIKSEMPGINVVDWEFEIDGPKVRQKRTVAPNHRLVTFMDTRAPGLTPMSTIRREFGLSESGTKDLQKTLRDDDASLTLRLKEKRCTYVGGRPGPGGGSGILKEAA